MKLIGIDIGTTTISIVVLDMATAEVVEARTIQNDSFVVTENRWERIQDPERIFHISAGVLDILLGKYPDIASIGLTGQMHGIVYVNAEGRNVSPLYTWQDGRGDLIEKDTGCSLVSRIRQRTELSVSTGYGLVTHLYQILHQTVPIDAVSICTIGDYIGIRLTGREIPLMHVSNAASLGFYNTSECAFYVEALENLGVDSGILPEVTAEFVQLGTYRDIPVTVAIGDNQASFLGSVGFKENTVLLNMGTGGQISVLSNNCYEAPGIEARPLTADRYLLVGASLCGGRAYAILEHFYRSLIASYNEYSRNEYVEIGDLYGLMERLANAGHRAEDPLRIATLFHGTRQNPTLRGSISNLGEDNFTPQALTYGILNGMARELYEMFEMIADGTGIHADTLVASGNGLRHNKVLQEICEEMFGCKLQMARYQEEAACGAAISSSVSVISG